MLLLANNSVNLNYLCLNLIYLAQNIYLSYVLSDNEDVVGTERSSDLLELESTNVLKSAESDGVVLGEELVETSDELVLLGSFVGLYGRHCS